VAIDGSVTAHRDCTGCPTPSAPSANVLDSAHSGGSKPAREVPPISPRENYGLSWYDLCPDGNVRAGAAYPGTGSVTRGTGPCTGDVLGSAVVSAYRGWRKVSDSASQGAGWRYEGSGTCTVVDSGPFCGDKGVFYVHRGSVTIGGSPGTSTAPWQASILTEASPNTPDEPHCPHTAGDIDITGSPRMRYPCPAANPTCDPDPTKPQPVPVLLVAGRDLRLSGNPGEGEINYEGALAAHEQFSFGGRPNIKGAVITEDACQTSGSLIDNSRGVDADSSRLTGSVTIVYDGGLQLPFGRSLRMNSWAEL
jgi:hypothetical protein